MTRCSLGAGCNTCTGLPREGQAVVAFPSASTLPISEYHKLKPYRHCPVGSLQTPNPMPAPTQAPFQHFSGGAKAPGAPHPTPLGDPGLGHLRNPPEGGCQKGAVRKGLPEAIQAPACGSPQPTGRPLNLGSC